MPVAPNPSEEHIGTVGGHILTPSANFTRPANTDAYAIGDLVANDTTAASVVPMQFTVARTAGGTGMIRRLRMHKTSLGVTSPSFRLHLYSTLPTIPANGDNAAWSTTGSAGYLGALEVTCDRVFTDGVCGSGAPLVGSEISFDLASGLIVYGLLEARGAYAPGNAEVITLTLEVLPN